MPRRLHSETLGGSRKWAALENHMHRMLYDRAIDITDPHGRFDADPVMFRARAVPRLELSFEEVEAALDDMERVGLIERWEVDGNSYAQIVDFGKYNNPDPAKEAQTRIPDRDGVVPLKPGRTDRAKPQGKTKARRAKPQGGPDSSPVPDEGKPRAGVGQAQGTPRVGAGQELGTLEGEGDVDKRVLSDGSGKNVLSQSVMSAGADDLQTLIEIWNADSGNLRKVRDIDAAKNTPELQRLTRAVVKRHGREKAHALFRQGIPAVANDPHWLGSRADKPSRPGAPYGILGYLRHVEEKAEAAASLTESPPPRPHRPWEVDFFAQRKDDLRVEQIDELLAGEQARMSNGEVWDLGECDLCNN